MSLAGGVIMSGLLQQVLEKASALPEDLQEIVAREWLDDIARFGRKGGEPSDLPPLPSFHMGVPKVDVANRQLLYEVMEREECS
jgi:hypothetical protein